MLFRSAEMDRVLTHDIPLLLQKVTSSCSILLYSMQRYAVLCCAILCYIILCHLMLSDSSYSIALLHLLPISLLLLPSLPPSLPLSLLPSVSLYSFISPSLPPFLLPSLPSSLSPSVSLYSSISPSNTLELLHMSILHYMKLLHDK